jgi:hypothetical protein
LTRIKNGNKKGKFVTSKNEAKRFFQNGESEISTMLVRLEVIGTPEFKCNKYEYVISIGSTPRHINIFSDCLRNIVPSLLPIILKQ